MVAMQKIDQVAADYLTEIFNEAEHARAQFAHVMADLMPEDPDDTADILAKVAYFCSLRPRQTS